jgi:hypothetical protein
MATKKKATKARRPPRVLWLVHPSDGEEGFTVGTKAAAERNAASTDRIVGPYVLAERVRER